MSSGDEYTSLSGLYRGGGHVLPFLFPTPCIRLRATLENEEKGSTLGKADNKIILAKVPEHGRNHVSPQRLMEK